MAQDSINFDSLQIEIETTPNPATLKFKLNQEITNSPKEFKNVEDSDFSPLAKKLWGFPWTSSVYIGQDFISVTKQDWVSWDYLATPLMELIKKHIQNGEDIILDARDSSISSVIDSKLIKEIKKILDLEIRPALRLDGGDVVLRGFQEGVLALQLMGACSGCPSATSTLKNGIEVRLRELFPEIKEVISI